MATSKKDAKDFDYQAVSLELDEIMARLEAGDCEVDEALACYERGLKLVEQLQAYLAKAENKVTALKTQYE